MKPVVFGPAPWRQRSWDWRAAANFVCGGGGSGLLICTVLVAPPEPLRAALTICATALVAIGLLCVWFEIGRPLRALNVFLNPFTSWMTREALFATALVPVALAAALGLHAAGVLAAVLAFAFLFSQGYILRAAKGIPAWRGARTPPLLIVTGLTEGAGVFTAVAAAANMLASHAWLGLGLLLAVRALLWQGWRRALGAQVSKPALATIDTSGRWLLLAGTGAPLLLLALAMALDGDRALLLRGGAGVLAALTGVFFKAELVGRASFNQGFQLAHLPVRGARR